MHDTAHSLFGILGILGIAWVLSEKKRRLPWRTVIAGMLLTVLLAVVLERGAALQQVLESMNAAMNGLERATQAGTSFVFGFLGGGAAPYPIVHPEAQFVLAFRALPLVLVVSALSALLFHWGVLQWVVGLMARLLQKTIGLGGAVGVSSAANVFVGMVEAPLVVKPYLRGLSRGELFIVMVCGMATIAGTVLVLYASILKPVLPNALAHLLVCSLVATPAAIVIAAIMVPPEATERAGTPIALPRSSRSAMDAVTRGTVEGLELLLSIVAMLVVFVALVSLANGLLSLLPDVAGAPVTLERILGFVMAPLAWACGVPWSEAKVAGALLGKKTILNELVAYLDLAATPESSLSSRSKLLMTYALCGFANFGSLGIMLGGMGAMVPERRDELLDLGLRSIAAGTLATCLTAAVVSLVV
jgi:CNT family concentrative nucleoside transporter